MDFCKPNYGLKYLLVPAKTDSQEFLKKKYEKILNFILPRNEEDGFNKDEEKENNMNIDYI